MESSKLAIQCYIDGWKKGDEKEILDSLAEDCLIIESHGPTYRGKKIVKEWIEEWRAQGNKVEKWNITSFHICGDLVVFEWVFAYQGKKIREAFEGVSLATIKGDKIATLREYRATHFPFMWGLV